MTDDEPWRRAMDDMDVEIVAVQKMAEGAAWPSVALALALIDKGVLDKGEMLDIIDSLQSIVRALEVPETATVDEALLGLRRLAEALEGFDPQPGQVQHQLRRDEQAWALKFLLDAARRRPRPE